MGDAGFDARALRRALGHYTTGVTIVTTRTPAGEHTGVTVNSFTSVSLDPPLVLFCLSTRSSLLAAFEQAEHFAINVLAKGQQALSNRFARPSVISWDGVNHRCGTQGCALLADAVATFECARRAFIPAATTSSWSVKSSASRSSRRRSRWPFIWQLRNFAAINRHPRRTSR
jgi:flavin reductase (DIM6/NTAB) family NADH-FMN oxidoreductase RutF